MVADEVRKLAEDSRKAASQIAGLLIEIRGGTHTAVSSMETGTHTVSTGVQALNHTVEAVQKERGRLIDAVVDAHKYVYGTKVAIYGDPDNVLGMLSLALENGMHPILVVASSKSPGFTEYAMERVGQVKPDCNVTILEDVDFDAFNDAVKKAKPEMLIGNSNGKYIAKEMGIPLVRVGFPIHDRVGARGYCPWDT